MSVQVFRAKAKFASGEEKEIILKLINTRFKDTAEDLEKARKLADRMTPSEYTLVSGSMQLIANDDNAVLSTFDEVRQPPAV